MSQLIAEPQVSDHKELERLCVSIRGKLQFMDYLLRATLADVDRFHDETDAGTRVFIRQLIEMHASNLTAESDDMRKVGEFCRALENSLEHPNAGDAHGDGE